MYLWIALFFQLTSEKIPCILAAKSYEGAVTNTEVFAMWVSYADDARLPCDTISELLFALVIFRQA